MHGADDWLSELISGAVTDAEQIALRERCSIRHVNMTISLAFQRTSHKQCHCWSLASHFRSANARRQPVSLDRQERDYWMRRQARQIALGPLSSFATALIANG